MSSRKRPRPVGETGIFLEDLNAQGVLTHAIACGVVLGPSIFREPLNFRGRTVSVQSQSGAAKQPCSLW